MSEVVKREREQWALESASGKQLAADLSSELDELRATALHHSGQLSPTAARVHELENEVKALKSQNTPELPQPGRSAAAAARASGPAAAAAA